MLKDLANPDEDRVVSTEYDALGRVRRVVDGKQQVTEYRYDQRDRQVQVRIYPQGYPQSARTLSREYDVAGNLIEEVDSDGVTTRHQYDNAGHKIETQRFHHTPATVYQDANHIPTDKWSVYDNDPTGATMTPTLMPIMAVR